MRLAFVDRTIRFSIPLGVTGIAAVLRRDGHEVALFPAGGDPDRAIDRIAAWGADAVGLSVLSGNHATCFEFARRLKERLPIPTIWGGPHPTFFPEMIELPFVDAVCLGEGEDAAALLAARFDQAGGRLPVEVPNFWLKRDGRIHRNPMLPRRRDLDALPWPARDLYVDQLPILRDHGIKHFLAHRGCPYGCTYCFNDSYNRLYRDNAGDSQVFHSRTPGSICDEILWTRERMPVRMVAFVDDVFTLRRDWTLDFARAYGQRVRIPFSINARFDNVDAEIVAALADAGLALVYAGVESGDEFLRSQVMHRRMTEASMQATAQLLRRRGVKLLTENILGLPGESFAAALRTLAVNGRLRPDMANASIFSPYPKLPMTRYSIEHGYFDGNPDRLNDNYYHGSALTFASERDRRRILNLRCFFSLLARHPRWLPIVRPLLEASPNAAYRWFGDLVDGFYLKRCVAFGFSPKDFIRTLVHFLRAYRHESPGGCTADAKRATLRSRAAGAMPGPRYAGSARPATRS